MSLNINLSLERGTRLTMKQWKELTKEAGFLDLSNELQNSFLMFGQFMNALISYQGVRYYATGWHVGRRPIVMLDRVKE